MPAIAAAHGFFHRVEAPEGGPIDEISVPFRRSTGGAQGGFGRAVLEPLVRGVPDVAAQGLGEARVSGRSVARRHRRRGSVGFNSAAGGLAGPIRHTAGVIHHNENIGDRYV